MTVPASLLEDIRRALREGGPLDARYACVLLLQEVDRLREQWEQLRAAFQDCDRQGYQPNAVAFMRGVESRAQESNHVDH